MWCLKPCYFAIVCFQDEQKLLSVEQSPVSVQLPSSVLRGSRQSREMNGDNSRSYFQGLSDGEVLQQGRYKENQKLSPKMTSVHAI